MMNIKNVHSVFALTIFIAFFFTRAGQAGTYYVATNGSDSNSGSLSQPFRTIERARDIVRASSASMTSDITVYVRGGTYFLPGTLSFDSTDSGKNGFNIVYKAYPAEKPVISGGQAISGWTPVGNGIYKAKVGNLQFRQLYINSKRGVRARTPNVGDYYRLITWDESQRQLVINADEIANWSRINEVEMVIQKHWFQDNLRIGSFVISGSEGYVAPLEPERSLTFDGVYPQRENNQAYHFENALEFLDAGGEWYLDRGAQEVFYKPRAGEDLSTASIIAPRLETLVRIQGSLSSPVHHLQFVNFGFEHSTWLFPSQQGFSGGQAITYRRSDSLPDVMPGAIHLENATNIHFERNIFRNLGATGVVLFSGASDNSLTGNVLTDLAGGGIAIDMLRETNPADLRTVSRRNIIRNNYIARVGQDYYGSVGIFLALAEGTLIEHNEVIDLPYSGVSVGWGWTLDDNPARDNVVRYNKIHRVMNLLDDGAGVYLMSKQPGTHVLENYIHDMSESQWALGFPNAAVYLDNGGSYITVENNAIENVVTGLYLQNFDPLAENNTIINQQGTIRGYTSGNTFINDNFFNATAVKANAGIEAGYRDILPVDSQLSPNTWRSNTQ